MEALTNIDEAKKKNEGDHQVGPELLQDDVEHGGEVADGGGAVPPMLEDEAEVGEGDPDRTCCCGRACPAVVTACEVALPC